MGLVDVPVAAASSACRLVPPGLFERAHARLLQLGEARIEGPGLRPNGINGTHCPQTAAGVGDFGLDSTGLSLFGRDGGESTRSRVRHFPNSPLAAARRRGRAPGQASEE